MREEKKKNKKKKENGGIKIRKTGRGRQVKQIERE